MKQIKTKRKLKTKILFLISYVMLLASFILAIISFVPQNKTTETVLSYKSDITCSSKVYNVDNLFYKPDYLENQEIYVSSITDKIGFTTDYNIEFSKDKQANYTVSVTGRLIAADLSNKEAILWEEPIEFNDVINQEKADKNTLNIISDFTFDFATAKSKLEKYQNTYGIVINGYALITVKVNINNLYDDLGTYTLVENNPISYKVLTITIPLMNKTFSINTAKPVSEEKSIEIISTNKDMFNEVLHRIGWSAFGFGMIFLLIAIKQKKKNMTNRDLYQQKVKEIINKYEEIIVRVEDLPEDNNLTEIKVLEFNDMVDMEQEVNSPIMLIELDHETIFTVIKGQYKYIYTIKEEDFI